MLTLYHAPNSRSTSIIALLHEFGLTDEVEVREVTIPRENGAGRRDPANPHPEGKVPLLVVDGEMIRERGAIITWLTDRFPEAKLGPLVGEAGRGEYLSWLFYYQGVIEPVALLTYIGVANPAMQATFRDVPTMVGAVDTALKRGPWLMGDRYTAADLLIGGAFAFFAMIGQDMAPDNPAIHDWVRRCEDRPGVQAARAGDERAA